MIRGDISNVKGIHTELQREEKEKNIRIHTWTSSSTTTSLGKIAIRPSKVTRLSIRAKAFQLCIGSGLFAVETSIQERTTFLSNGRSCLTTKFSPKSPPGKANEED